MFAGVVCLLFDVFVVFVLVVTCWCCVALFVCVRCVCLFCDCCVVVLCSCCV